MLNEPLLAEMLEQIECIDAVLADALRDRSYLPSAEEWAALVALEECLFSSRVLASLLINV